MKKIKNIIFVVFVTALILYVNVFVVKKLVLEDDSPGIFGVKSFIVYSGSMEPTLNVGDIVFVEKTDDIEIDDTIAFRENDSVVTHRVVEVIIDENFEKSYITKGDSNDSNDLEPVKLSDIEGRYKFKIGSLGNVVLFFKTGFGMMFLFIVFFLGYLVQNKNA